MKFYLFHNISLNTVTCVLEREREREREREKEIYKKAEKPW